MNDATAGNAESEQLRAQIRDLQDALSAISSGGVDAVVVGPPGDQQVYTLNSADRPYRVIVESMGEGAATVSDNGLVLFANHQFAQLLGRDRDAVLGRRLDHFVNESQRGVLLDLLRAEASETRRAEIRLRVDDQPVPVLVSVTGLDIEGALVRCLLVTDLTMQRRIDEHVAREAAREEQRARNAQLAREVNDTIVQGLVAAEMALDLHQTDRARALIAVTSVRARDWIDEMAGEEKLRAGMAVRSTPAEWRTDGSS